MRTRLEEKNPPKARVLNPSSLNKPQSLRESDSLTYLGDAFGGSDLGLSSPLGASMSLFLSSAAAASAEGGFFFAFSLARAVASTTSLLGRIMPPVTPRRVERG